MPRIRPVFPEEATGSVVAVYEELTKTKWRIPSMYQILAHNLEILKAHEAYFDAVMNRGTLERKLKEKVAYKVAKLNGCSYSTASHYRYALKCGATKEDMDAVDEMKVTSMESKEATALKLAVSMNQSGKDISDELFKELERSYSRSEIIELFATVGLMIFASRLADALGLEPDTNIE